MAILEVYNRLGSRWAVSPAILKDIHTLMQNDMQFYSTRNGGIRYVLVQRHLEKHYKIFTINERQLRYLVKEVKRAKKRVS